MLQVVEKPIDPKLKAEGVTARGRLSMSTHARRVDGGMRREGSGQREG